MIGGGRILDLAPTILYCLGLPIPREMDGRVLERAFDRAFKARNPIQYSNRKLQDDDLGDKGRHEGFESREVAERFRELGYL